jgi:dipeptidyl aminopeptidase/acylaminoacyl peptidase
VGAFDDLADFVALPRITALCLAPDGSWLAAVVSSLSADRKRYASALWRVDPGGGPARRLTRSAAGEAEPAFLPDGRLLFVSKRAEEGAPEPAEGAEKPALWLLPAGAGEARRIATWPGGIRTAVVARDTGTVVVAADVMPGAADRAGDERQRTARRSAGVGAVLHEQPRVRYWDHDLGPDAPQLMAAPPPGDGDLDEPRGITPGAGRALDEQTFSVSPDGRTVVTGWAVLDPPADVRTELVAIDVSTGERRVLAGRPEDGFLAPAISPDGRFVACIRERRATYDTPPDRVLHLIDLAAGHGRDLTGDLERWPAELAWAGDASAVYFTADEAGRCPVFRVQVADGRITRLAGDGHYQQLCPAPDGSALYALRDRIDAPPTVVRLDPEAADQEPVALDAPGAVQVPGALTEVQTVVADGTEVRGYLALPSGAGPDAPAPLVLWMHGGPLSSWNAWSWRWNPWLLVARGYAVLMPDPALSTGYGPAMIERGWGQYGGAPYTDVMAITDEAVKRADIDEGRTAAMGGSFGGYLANWVAGQTDRFSAIVTHASLWNLDAFEGVTDEAADWEREFGSAVERPERYLRWSPHRQVRNIRTPMLVIHGDKDYRVPIGEGLRLWWDLQRHGVAAKFLYFPDENHWVLRPGSAIVWYETVLAFLATHVLGEPWTRPALV